MARYDAVFFDLYGTLIDIRTDEWSQAAWEALRVALNDAGAGYADGDEAKRRFDEELAREMETLRAAGIDPTKAAAANLNAEGEEGDGDSGGTAGQ